MILRGGRQRRGPRTARRRRARALRALRGALLLVPTPHLRPASLPPIQPSRLRPNPCARLILTSQQSLFSPFFQPFIFS